MTETTAKQGMLWYKKGYGKNDFEYAYLEDIPYNANLSVRNLIKGLQAEDKNLKLENEVLKKQLIEVSKSNATLDEKLKLLETTVEEIKTKYYEALKGVITR
jgi:hypothetical protein